MYDNSKKALKKTVSIIFKVNVYFFKLGGFLYLFNDFNDIKLFSKFIWNKWT